MPKSVSYIHDSQSCKTTTYFNKSLASKIPSHSSHFARCIHEFSRLVLIIDNTQPSWDAWYQPPSHEQIQEVNQMPMSITTRPVESLPIILESLGSAKPIRNTSIPIDYQLLFKSDISSSGFPIPCFSWNQPWEAKWNQLMMEFILKHWNNAYHANAFTEFPFNPEDNSAENKHCILHRWFKGKQNLLRRGQLLPPSLSKKKNQIKKSKWRKKASSFLHT